MFAPLASAKMPPKKRGRPKSSENLTSGGTKQVSQTKARHRDVSIHKAADYSDLSDSDPPPASGRTAKRGRGEPSSGGVSKQKTGRIRLPDKLFQYLEEKATPALFWQKDGEGFSIDSNIIQEELLDKYFYGTKLSSFMRSLNRWYVNLRWKTLQAIGGFFLSSSNTLKTLFSFIPLQGLQEGLLPFSSPRHHVLPTSHVSESSSRACENNKNAFGQRFWGLLCGR